MGFWAPSSPKNADFCDQKGWFLVFVVILGLGLSEKFEKIIPPFGRGLRAKKGVLFWGG